MNVQEFEDKFLSPGPNAVTSPNLHETGHSRAVRTATVFGFAMLGRTLEAGLRMIAASITKAASTVAGQGKPASTLEAEAEARRAARRAQIEAAARAKAEAEIAAAELDDLATEGDPS